MGILLWFLFTYLGGKVNSLSYVSLTFNALASFDYRIERQPLEGDIRNISRTQDFILNAIKCSLSTQADVAGVYNTTVPTLFNGTKFVHLVMNGTIQIQCSRLPKTFDVCSQISCVLRSLNSSSTYRTQHFCDSIAWERLLTGVSFETDCTGKTNIPACPSSETGRKACPAPGSPSSPTKQLKQQEDKSATSVALPVVLSVLAAAATALAATLLRRRFKRKVDDENKTQGTNKSPESVSGTGLGGALPSPQWADKTGNTRFKVG